MSALPPVRPPLQARSQATLDRVLQAGAEIVREGHWEAFTVAEICRRADIRTGSFYARFTTKDSLLVAVQERILGEIEDDERAAFTGTDWDELATAELVSTAVHTVVDLMRRHGPALHVLLVRAAEDDRLRAAGSASARRLGEDFTRCVLARRHDLAHPDPELALRVCTRVLLDALARRLTAGRQTSDGIGWDVFADELTAMIVAYLGARPVA